MKPDKKIILALNRPLGIMSRPFAAAARKLGWKESRLLDNIRAYKKQGLIRRFGFVLAHRNIGFKSNVLVAWKVPAGSFARAENIFKAAEEISHCYQRKTFPDWPYNVYTMVHGADRQSCWKLIRELSRKAGIKDYRVFFTLKELKKTKADIWSLTS
jgi:siroheme decarboxylase